MTWWTSPDSVSLVSTISQVFGGMLGLWIVVIGVRSSQLQDRQCQNTAQEIARANEGQAKANQRAKTLEQGTAVLQKEAAVAKLDLERLKQKVAARQISQENSAKFISYVKQAPKNSIIIEYMTNSDEVVSFAKQIKDLLKAAGYAEPSEFLSVAPIGRFMTGLVLYVRDTNNQTAVGLQQGFTSIGFDIQAVLRPGQRADVLLEIGAKKTN